MGLIACFSFEAICATMLTLVDSGIKVKKSLLEVVMKKIDKKNSKFDFEAKFKFFCFLHGVSAAVVVLIFLKVFGFIH